MSESHPNACTPCLSATCTMAGESVFWESTSAPCAISASAACRSLPGSYQVSTQMTLVVALGLTLRAPKVKASMLRITSGMGNDPTKPKVFDLVVLPARTPSRYAHSWKRVSYVTALDAFFKHVACAN